MEVSSMFTSHEFVSTFKKFIKVSGARDENRVMVDPVTEDEYVTTVNNQEPHYFYMYTHVLQTLNLWLPFTPFESQILKAVNVAPCQLHPNSWAFVKAFEGDLIARETNPPSLGEYLGEGFFVAINCSSCMATKIRAKAVAAAASTDCLSQLVIDESGTKGSKRKNQEDSKRITVEVPKKKKVANTEEEGDDLDEPLKRKRMPRGRGQPPPLLGGSSHNHADLEAMTKEVSPSITCCAANPVKKKKKGSSPPNFWTSNFDSLSYIDEGFKKYVDPLPLADVSSEDMRKATMDHHVQGALFSYFLSARQELEVIEAKQRMEMVDKHMGSLEEEYAATKSKLEGDIMEIFPLSFLLNLNPPRSPLPRPRTYHPEEESWDSDQEFSQVIVESKLTSVTEKKPEPGSPCNSGNRH
ncbi:hypothetical protein TSUD_137740 [Trifolium subterraneum]|uniref:Uncharacterized protein n=1 Tax=Trifolium subterraneum TaxID=3900 RepID=A0A2Z6PQ24_TRISU|nr:hypothetical protein TSUD_137740 [Trifolium subterraneum]